ncbi:VWA domain-containing protein [Thiocystis violacea]|uniref:VWA domain-containing protein n=1 Tax=Thiocystis violacea TaxID=13725 RepID=UPI001908591A|nr:VWA domain-containing protein [Thiocystis violacea]MBK1721271.1 hypothetical protein [Thiocystis violacea]
MLTDLSSEEGGELLRRWRLILGPAAEETLGSGFGSGSGAEDAAAASAGQARPLLADRDRQRDALLEHLYGREHAQRVFESTGARRAGQTSSGLSVPRWLAGVRALFPQSTAETLQRQALERYGMRELLVDPRVLRQAPADLDTVRLLIQFRALLSDQAMGEARRLIRTVVAALDERLARRARNSILGPRLRQEHGGARMLANLDWATTLRRNLKHYQPELGVVIPERLWFWRRQRRQLSWDLILLVDQSGSMLSSVIHSAVLAAVFHGLRVLRTRLVLFDTRVVDVSERIGDPVEVLLGVQLGGGTDIAAAMDYARGKVETPRRTLIVLISDFYEGGNPAALVELTARLHQSGVALLGLAALDERGTPDYDRPFAARLAAAGMEIGAMTPDRLADWVGEAMARRG